jgi:hypothetical protein
MTELPRNATWYASWPPLSDGFPSLNVAIEISSSPFGDFTATGPVCAAEGHNTASPAAINNDSFG